MGFLIAKPNAAFTSFVTVNQRVQYNSFRNPERSINKTLQTYQFKEKGDFSYEFNYMTEAEFRSLFYIVKNRSSLREGLLLIPVPYSEYESYCNLTPTYNTTNKAYWGALAAAGGIPWEKAYADLGKSELSEAEYGKINIDDTNYLELAATAATYKYFLFDFDLTNFINGFSYKEIRRLTLPWIGMSSSPVRFFIWSPTQYARYLLNPTKETIGWYNIDDKYYYDDEKISTSSFYLNRALVSAFALPYGNSSIYTDFLDGSNLVKIMAVTGEVNKSLLLQYVRLLVNGYHVCPVDPEDFENYANAFTGAGRTGVLRMSEI